jgi:hypothetical protein
MREILNLPAFDKHPNGFRDLTHACRGRPKIALAAQIQARDRALDTPSDNVLKKQWSRTKLVAQTYMLDGMRVTIENKS